MYFFRKSCSAKCSEHLSDLLNKMLQKNLVAGESLAGLARAGADVGEVGDGFGFAHLPRQQTFDSNILHGLSQLVTLHLRLFRTSLEERISGDVSTVAVSRGEIDPSINQTFPSVILKRVVQYVSLR